MNPLFLRTLISFLSSILLLGSLSAQEYRSGELIVQLETGMTPADLYPAGRAESPGWKAISSRKNIYLLHFSERTDLQALRRALSRKQGIKHVQYNRIMKKRGGVITPNDPRFDLQWNLERIGLPEIWDRTTGGITPCGDTIVVAVNDFGFDMEHEDLQGIIWKNHREIPNNGFDDDQNGYIDDYLGLNLDSGTDRHEVDTIDYHGTSIASLIGSNSNNGIGIAGINWNIKLLIVSSIEKDEAQAIESFEYVRDLRERYNVTNGAEGAYIVALNNSWGYEGGYEEDFPILCGLFDDLGEVGIIPVGSTENDQVNTDVFGDFPSDCSSEFLITVTSTDRFDNLAVAGFGSENVDLAAPGEEIHLAGLNNNYRNYGGTSYATPHVSGAIALLYSLPEAPFCDHARIDPAATLLDIKRFLLEGTTPQPTLQGKTVSGGRLNLSLAIDLATSTQEVQHTSFSLFPNPAQLWLQADASSFNGEVQLRVIDAMGREIEYLSFVDPGLIRLDINSWPAGIYLVELQNTLKRGAQKVVKF